MRARQSRAWASGEGPGARAIADAHTLARVAEEFKDAVPEAIKGVGEVLCSEREHCSGRCGLGLKALIYGDPSSEPVCRDLESTAAIADPEARKRAAFEWGKSRLIEYARVALPLLSDDEAPRACCNLAHLGWIPEAPHPCSPSAGPSGPPDPSSAIPARLVTGAV